MTRYNKRKNSITIIALLTIILSAVLIFSLRYPDKLQRFINASTKFDTTQDFIKFMDVGQGDSALIYSNGYSAIIDLGMHSSSNDISTDLANCNIYEIDAILISHLHSDHIGALPNIAKSYKIKNLIMPEIFEDSILAAKSGKETALNKGTAFYNAVQGLNFNIGEFEITLLSDFSDKSNENNRSVFAMVKIGDIDFLFTGDAEESAEKLLLNENLNIDCDVLKVSHHGSDSSSCQEFLKAVTPEYAVISVGEDNIYSHPHNATIESLKNIGAKTYRTDQNGDVTFYVENGDLKITTEK